MVAPQPISERVIIGALDQTRVQGLTHDFYKYPARFSPMFARSAINELTAPGDLVVDPFMGGGTTAVEALAAGRRFAGTDTSRLAYFVTNTKTTPVPTHELDEVIEYLTAFCNEWTIAASSRNADVWSKDGYLRNMERRTTWRLTRIISAAIECADTLAARRQRRFARAVVLRTAQRAIDTRREFPDLDWFRAKLVSNAREMATALQGFTQLADASTGERYRLLLRRPAETLTPALLRGEPPRLIVTSPPYPTVHVLYHRWQLEGGKETPAPFWIAGVRDGDPAAYYTLAGRHDEDGYFSRLGTTFRAIREICGPRTVMVQLVAFKNMESQLPRYLEAMRGAGFRELNERTERHVPGRRWYTQRAESDSAREVALFHSPV